MNDRIVIIGVGVLLCTSVLTVLVVVLSRQRRETLQLAEVWQEVARRRGLETRQLSWQESLRGVTHTSLISGSSVVQGLSVTLNQKPGRSTHLSGVCPWIGEGQNLSISSRPPHNRAASVSKHGLVAEWYPETFRARLDDDFLDSLLRKLSELPTFAWCSIDGRDAYRAEPRCTISLKGHCRESRTLELALDTLEGLCRGGPLK
jgi:hypothetical protein